MTGYEALLIQGFPKEYADKVKDIVGDRHLLMQAGNAMTVGVIKALGESLQKYIAEAKVDTISVTTNTPEAVSISTSPKDALVGVVKSLAQFNYCLDKNIYYTYEAALEDKPENIRYVCMYQPKNVFGQEKAGIYLYGKVAKAHHVKRSQIHFEIDEKKRDRKCIVFQVEGWRELTSPVKPSSKAKVLMATTFQKIEAASSYNDLY